MKDIDAKKWKLYESAMIKSIRRGLVDDAVYWAHILYSIGREHNVWRRLIIHVSEDIGPANQYLPATISALKDNYQYLRDNPASTAYGSVDASILPLIHAVMLMANSKKSRAVDNAKIVHFDLPHEVREAPDYATDFHSPRGRRMGRDIEHFLDVAAHIENESDFYDEWKDKARKIIDKQG